MKKNIFIVMCIFLALGCTEDIYNNDTIKRLMVEVSDHNSYGGSTRSTISGLSTSFETGDMIGVYGVDGSSGVTSNACFTRNSSGEWESASLIGYNANYSYYAYYPYVESPYTPDFTASGVDEKFSLFIADASDKFHNADQSNKANYNASDLMISEGTHTGGSTVHFTFQHKKGLAKFTGGAASATWTGNIPYKPGDSYAYFLMKPSTSTGFTDDGESYSLSAASGKYVIHNVRTSASYTAPSARSLTYNGGAQNLINAGSTSDGTMQYSTNGSSWSTTIPTGTTAGNYTVYWRIIGDADHIDKPAASIAVNIAKASRSISFTSAPSSVEDEKTVTVRATPSAGSGDGGVTYSTSSSSIASINSSTGVATGKTAGTVTITATIAEGTNYRSASTSYSMTVVVYWVNLGLPSGTKWAKGNIVSNGSGGYKVGSPSDRGAYFSWGNRDPHFSSNGSTFDGGWSWGSGNATSPYGSSVGSGISTVTTGRSYTANTTYDAGQYCLGGSWKVPTNTQFQELLDNTDNTWTTINGVNGYKFMKKTDHSVYIFLPVCGYGNGTSVSANTNGYYWSSSLSSGTHGSSFIFGSTGSPHNGGGLRYVGRTVRAVK